MQKEQNCLRIDLELAEAQIKSLLTDKAKPKQSADSAAIKSYMTGITSRNKVLRFNKAEDLQAVKVAARVAAEVFHIESLNYRPRGFGLKTQFTGTDTTAYAP